MDEDQARARVRAERAEVQKLLKDTEIEGRQDRATEDEEGVNISDPAQPLTAQLENDAITASLRDRLAALERAEQRLDNGTYGRSVRSGLPIPDERLEADPARTHHRGGQDPKVKATPRTTLSEPFHPVFASRICNELFHPDHGTSGRMS